MIKKLTFLVTFASTGRTFTGDHTFSKGTTAISGANEKGKSLRLEMIRYALFGQKALRATKDQYEKIGVSLEFVVAERSYTVTRSGTTARLSSGKDKLVSGTKPVNEKIISLLGFDLSVFDVANNCMQGEVDALSRMKPTERKAMVDQTVGLNDLDDVVSFVAAEIRTRNAQLEVLERLLERGLPEEPVKPAGYAPLEHIQRGLEDSEAVLKQVARARMVMEQPVLTQPDEPQHPGYDDVETLREHEALRSRYNREHALLSSRIAAIPQSPYTVEELDEAITAHVAHQEYLRGQYELQQIVRPEYTLEALEDMDEAWALIRRHRDNDNIKSRIKALMESNVHTCSACGHTEPLAQAQIEELRQELVELPPPPEEPDLSPQQILKERKVVADYAKKADRVKQLREAPVVAPPRLDFQEANRWRDIALRANERQSLQEQLDKLPVLEDKTDSLLAMDRYEQQLTNYQDSYKRWEVQRDERVEAQQFIDQHPGIDETVDKLRDLRVKVQIYDSQYDSWKEQAEKFDDLKSQIDTLKEEVVEHKSAQEGLKKIRLEVKKYLVPSLNRMASHLLNVMTNGERSVIYVDEEFNIAVDGQPIDTLSGSGVAVANLAIRLGLGRVLTHKTFSVFMADEVDAAMDDNRATHTIGCLKQLKGSVDQILIVSHKEHDVDHDIAL